MSEPPSPRPEPDPPDPEDTAAEATPSLTSSAVRGFAWQVASFGGNRLIVFASTLALARLLVPKDFGVFAAALAFTQYLEVLLDFGVSSYLVYDQERGVTDRLHIAFTVTLVLTVVLTGASVGLAPLTAKLFGAPQQTDVFAVMSLYLFLRGWSQVNEAVISRDLLFKKLVGIDLVGAVTRAGLSVGLAVAGAGVWSIVAGFLAGQVVSTVTAYVVVRYRPRLRFERHMAAKMLKFGMNSVALDLLTEVSINGDYVVVGSMIGATALGVYTIAYRLPELLINNLFWMFAQVAFPVYSRSRVAGIAVLRRAMLKSLELITLYGFAVGIGLAIVARDAVLTLFGAKWDAAITPMEILALAAALASTNQASGALFPAMGKPGTLVAVNIPLTVVRVVGFVVAAPYGIVWVATIHLGTNAVLMFVRFAIANRVVGTTATQTARALAPGLVAGVGVVAFALPVRLVMTPGAVALVATVAAGVAGAVVSLAVSDRRIFSEIRNLGRALVRPT